MGKAEVDHSKGKGGSQHLADGDVQDVSMDIAGAKVVSNHWGTVHSSTGHKVSYYFTNIL